MVVVSGMRWYPMLHTVQMEAVPIQVEHPSMQGTHEKVDVRAFYGWHEEHAVGINGKLHERQVELQSGVQVWVIKLRV